MQKKTRQWISFQGKRVSPESFFIRTGKIPEGMNPARAKKLGTRFLSWVWFEEAAKRKRTELPLPTFRQRLFGGVLPKADRIAMESQIGFALKEFAFHLPARERAKVAQRVNELVSKRILSISLALREKTGSDLRQMRVQGREMLTNFRESGEMHIGLMQDKSGKVFFAKGWANKKSEKGIALHETMHVLQKLGVIKVDVPFAEAARWLYGLEQNLFKPNPRLRTLTREDFDRKALPEKSDERLLYEAQWSYNLGDRIGQWIFQNLSGKQRWDYLRLRCNGASHADALRILRRQDLLPSVSRAPA